MQRALVLLCAVAIAGAGSVPCGIYDNDRDSFKMHVTSVTVNSFVGFFVVDDGNQTRLSGVYAPNGAVAWSTTWHDDPNAATAWSGYYVKESRVIFSRWVKAVGRSEAVDWARWDDGETSFRLVEEDACHDFV